MADAARIGPLTDQTAPASHRHAGHRAGALSFQAVLDRAFKAHADVGYLAAGRVHSGSHAGVHTPIQQAASRVPAPWSAMPRGTATAEVALTQAMVLENVPPSWRDSLRFIMNSESGGQVGVHNPVHSARGLFQLTAANYHLNPRGAASFGNAVEEAQGGIRYIRQRYGTADSAVAHWQQHRWY
jgi:hypothetical protein